MHNAADTACWRHTVADDIYARHHAAYTLGGCRKIDWCRAAINPTTRAAARIVSFEELQRLRVAHARDAPPMTADGHERRSLP